MLHLAKSSHPKGGVREEDLGQRGSYTTLIPGEQCPSHITRRKPEIVNLNLADGATISQTPVGLSHSDTTESEIKTNSGTSARNPSLRKYHTQEIH